MPTSRATTIWSHRAWTYGALLSAAAFAITLLYLDALVALGVDCATYEGAANGAVAAVGLVAFVLATLFVLLNIVRGILLRSWPVVLLSVILACAVAGLIWFTIYYTFGYCMFHGADLPACLFGCAH